MSSNETPRNNETPRGRPIFHATPSELYEQYKRNPLRMMRDYNGEFMTVEGKISEISEEYHSDRRYIVIWLSDGNNQFPCWFDKKYEDNIMNVETGQRFAATGTWSSEYIYAGGNLVNCVWAPEYLEEIEWEEMEDEWLKEAEAELEAENRRQKIRWEEELRLQEMLQEENDR